MTDESRPGGSGPGGRTETSEQRRRRLEAVFGDVLPDTTRDERDDAEPSGRGPGDSASEAWLREQVPPHHGG